ncbi:MAG TPA: alpha/beta hydrolase [Ktedonobacteraceae bacterium]|jgi:alpha-beta hydrolase superfamily lysophospholipase
MRYNIDLPGEWGSMRATPQVQIAVETLAMADGCQLFLRSWRTSGAAVLLLVHGLGAHGGWFIDLGNELAAADLSVYAVDHRGFGRSDGQHGHVERGVRYIEDLVAVLSELRRRHSDRATRFFVLGHSMGGIFATHLAAKHSELLDGVLFLNPWVQDSSKVSPGMLLGVFGGGLLRSRRYWPLPGGTEVMTGNPEAVRMLSADPYWRRACTANFLLEIFRLRLQVLKLATHITLPALVMQAEQDKSVVPAASRKLYEALGSVQKTWQAYPDYAHDTELEADRACFDRDIVAWIRTQVQS